MPTGDWAHRRWLVLCSYASGDRANMMRCKPIPFSLRDSGLCLRPPSRQTALNASNGWRQSRQKKSDRQSVGPKALSMVTRAELQYGQ